MVLTVSVVSSNGGAFVNIHKKYLTAFTGADQHCGCLWSFTLVRCAISDGELNFVCVFVVDQLFVLYYQLLCRRLCCVCELAFFCVVFCLCVYLLEIYRSTGVLCEYFLVVFSFCTILLLLSAACVCYALLKSKHELHPASHTCTKHIHICSLAGEFIETYCAFCRMHRATLYFRFGKHTTRHTFPNYPNKSYANAHVKAPERTRRVRFFARVHLSTTQQCYAAGVHFQKHSLMFARATKQINTRFAYTICELRTKRASVLGWKNNFDCLCHATHLRGNTRRRKSDDNESEFRAIQIEYTHTPNEHNFAPVRLARQKATDSQPYSVQTANHQTIQRVHALARAYTVSHRIAAASQPAVAALVCLSVQNMLVYCYGVEYMLYKDWLAGWLAVVAPAAAAAVASMRARPFVCAMCKHACDARIIMREKEKK